MNGFTATVPIDETWVAITRAVQAELAALSRRGLENCSESATRRRLVPGRLRLLSLQVSCGLRLLAASKDAIAGLLRALPSLLGREGGWARVDLERYSLPRLG